VDEDEELPDAAQALSVLEKALRDAIAVVPLDEVVQRVTAMFPRTRVEIDSEPGRLHHRVQKVSVSMPEELITAIRERTGPGGFSRYVTEAADRRLRLDGLRELLDELYAEVGPVSPELLEQARREWPDYEEE
jgi:hypothetical protein